MTRFGMFALTFAFVLGSVVVAEDWPQWRGADRDGKAAKGPALAEKWPKEGPPKVWQSEPIPSDSSGGFSSIAIVGERAFVFVSWKISEPIATRTLPERNLRRLGWFPKKPADDVVAAVEKARASEERAAAKGRQVNEWTKKWVEANLSEEQRKNRDLMRFVGDRLRRGKGAIDLAVLDKIAGIKNKAFASQEELDKWFADNGVEDNLKKTVQGQIPTKRDYVKDFVVCLNAKDGKTVWKKEYPGRLSSWGASGTPCIVGGRCYAVGSDGGVYCLKVEDGAEVWKKKVGGGAKNSSILVVGNAVILASGPVVALDAEKGEQLWEQKKVKGGNSSAVAWKSGENTYVIVNGHCMDVKSGEVVWSVKGWGSSTPVVTGDKLVVFSGNKSVGVATYKLTPKAAEELWKVDGVSDRGASPIVHEGKVYVTGSKVGVMAVDLASGKKLWQKKARVQEISSPIWADGKIFTPSRSGLAVFKPGAEDCEDLGNLKVEVNRCTSPAIVNGRLYLRGKVAVYCYDLTKKAE